MFIDDERARIIVQEDRELTENVLKRYRRNEELNDEELTILRAEVQKILKETPEDEELPDFYGYEFEPIDYKVAKIMVKKLTNEKHPIALKGELVHGALDKTRTRHDYKQSAYGAREFENVDMRDAFIQKHELDSYFDCYFLKTKDRTPYKAWFYKDFKGVVRYYTKNPYNHYDSWVFDAIDLYGLLVGGESTLNHAEKSYLRHISYKLIREQQELNYSEYVSQERERLYGIQAELDKMNENSTFNGVNGTMYAVLSTLIDEAVIRTFEHSHNDEHDRTMFFISNKEVSTRMKRYYSDKNIYTSVTLVNNSINLLASLGFIKKLSDEDIFRGEDSYALADIRRDYAKNGWNQINYYVIRDIPSVYWVNKQMNKLNKKDITINNVTRKKLTRAVGKELTDKIYVLDGLSVKTPEFEEERNEYARRFLFEIQMKGFVTKQELDGIISSKNVTNSLWTELVNNLPGQSVRRTTKVLREDLDIDTIGGVFISYALIHPNRPITLGIKSEKEVHNSLLLEVYEELTEEVMYWYGDVFVQYRRKQNNEKGSILFAEFLRTGVAPAALFEIDY